VATAHWVDPEGERETKKFGPPKRASVEAWFKKAMKAHKRTPGLYLDYSHAITLDIITFTWPDGSMLIIDRKREGVDG
jgi:hypothetical protein